MTAPSLPDDLTIPGTSTVLGRTNSHLESAGGDSFPIVYGVPVVFPRGGLSTFPAYLASLQITDATDPWQLQTLAISEARHRQVRAMIDEGHAQRVDPVVSHLVLATNGIAYSRQVGRLGEYPIPDVQLDAQPGARLLDLGCSWGRWCISAARKGYNVTGIDPSLGALLAAQRVAKEIQVSPRYVCGDARCLPFANEAFDVVHSYSVLQHFSDEDATATWSEAARVLRPGGVAIIQMANVIGARSLYHIARRGFRSPNRFEVRYRTPAKLLAMARRAMGRAKLEIDCFFGLGLQDGDRRLYSWPARAALSGSNMLKAISRVVPPLKLCAIQPVRSSGQRSMMFS